MPTQRRFEGATLAAVLAKVQKEVGTNAKIASAQKVRTGGFLGFFQKERYEVLVDVDASTAAAPAPAAAPAAPVSEAPAAASVMDLVDQVNQQERPAATPAPVPPAPAVAPTPVAPPAPVSTESDSFAEVLSRLAFQSDMGGDSDPKANPAATAKQDDEPPAEAVVEEVPETVEAVVEDEPEPVVEDEPEVIEDVVEDEPEVIEDVVADEPEAVIEDDAVDEPEAVVDDESEEDVTDEVADEEESEELEADEEPVTAEVVEDALEPEPIDLEPVIIDPAAPMTPAAVVPAEPVIEPVVAPIDATPLVTPRPITAEPTEVLSTAVVTAATTEIDLDNPRTRATDHPLARLGLPVQYIPEWEEGLRPTAVQKKLAAALDELPKAPKIRPSKGAVIAVVGNREEAMWTASELALKWGRPEEEIVLASQHYRGKNAKEIVRTIRGAEDSRRSWSRRANPTIVVIDTPLGAQNTSWAEHLLVALEPIATYGVVDATRKAEDVSAWVGAIGGVDALALNHVEETVSPASVLTTGIPVDSIDGRAATPAYWAMLLTERLVAA